MPSLSRCFLNPRCLLQLALAAFSGALIVPSLARADAPASELKLVVILTRHGVRSPLQTNETLGKYAAEPWPKWNVTPGIQTPHGRQQMVLMGKYYHDRFLADGLLSGNAPKDATLLYLRSDNDQRTIETTQALAEGFIPGLPAPGVHARPKGEADALFQFVKVYPKLPDSALAVSAVLGRFGNDPANLFRAYQPEFTALQHVLSGPGDKLVAGKIALLDLPVQVTSGTGDHTVAFNGPLRVAEQIVDAFILEYAEGLPMADVGWGRLSPELLTQLIRLHTLQFTLADGTFYSAQAQGSNLARHLQQTLAQATQGKPVNGAFGAVAQKIIILGGHDTNIANLGGLLGLNWYVPGAQVNPLLPGGALVFELRQRHADSKFVVRTYYAAQTLEQNRSLSPLTLEHPPALAPIFVPDCSEAGPGYDVPLEKFDALLQRVIDPKFVIVGTP